MALLKDTTINGDLNVTGDFKGYELNSEYLRITYDLSKSVSYYENANFHIRPFVVDASTVTSGTKVAVFHATPWRVGLIYVSSNQYVYDDTIPGPAEIYAFSFSHNGHKLERIFYSGTADASKKLLSVENGPYTEPWIFLTPYNSAVCLRYQVTFVGNECFDL